MLTQENNAGSVFHKAALTYVKKFSLEVIPVVPRNKNPIPKSGVKEATQNETLINSWWSQWPEANVAIATGPDSGLVVLDFDLPDPENSLTQIQREFGDFPLTPFVVTGKGGFHYYFATNECFKNYVGFRPGVDVRSAGGFVVAPPSIHPNGNRYRWDSSAHISKIPLANLPEKLAQALRSNSAEKSEKRPVDHWVNLATSGVSEGKRNQSLAEFCGHLLRANVDAVVVAELMHSWNETRCNPPLSKWEVERVLNSISRAEFERRIKGGASGTR